MLVDFDVRGETVDRLFSRGSVIMDLYCGQKQRFKVKTSWWILLQTRSFLLHKMLIDIFISCLNCRGSTVEQVMQHFSKSVQMKNKLIYILDGLRVSRFSAIFHFWANY